MSERNGETFRAAAEAYKAEVAQRTQITWTSSFWNDLDALVEAVQGLDLTPREWHLMEWFISWDSLDVLASIINKARRQGV